MKKILPLLIIIISFIYTKSLVSVVKNYDDIMIKIKQEKHKYYIKPIEAIIENDTIIPGIKGKEVDINKTYSKMKRYGKYEESLIVLKDIEVKNHIDKDKYIISGNKNKNMVTLIFDKKVDNKYCYIEKKEECSGYKIIPNIILKDNYYRDIKRYLRSGSIISLYTSEKLNKELPLIIKYIHLKGYKIVDLNTLLEE